MALLMPAVGYVPATREGADPASGWNSKKFSTVDLFVGALRTSFLEGWSEHLAPCGLERSDNSEYSIDRKNLEHIVRYEDDFENRPELLNLIKFIRSEPGGGFICVRDEQDITNIFSFGQGAQLSPELCSALQVLLEIPVVVCGRPDNRNSLYNRLLSSRGDSRVVRDIVQNAISWWPRNDKRISTFRRTGRLCRFSEKLSVSAEDQDYIDTLFQSGLLCGGCRKRFGYE